jgi:asparagine synthase (glutamine-hydrolysing)
MGCIAGVISSRHTGEHLIHPLLDAMPYRCDSRKLLPGIDFVFGSSASTGFQTQTGISIVADARLEDRDVLAHNLNADPNATEAQLILGAYQKWGARCVEHFYGGFAFVIYDGHRLFCARDHLGIKPFYYALRDSEFVFSSEARPIARHFKMPVNETRIADSLFFPLEHVDSTSTFYQSIERLPAATILAGDLDNIRLSHYWQPPTSAIATGTAEEHVLMFRELLSSSVSNHMDEGTAASCLSGGVDSTTVDGFANQTPGKLKTFSTVADTGETCLDSECIALAISEMGLDAELLRPADVSTYADDCLMQLGQLQEPFDYYMIQSMLLNLSAAKNGFKYLLDGVEGDLLYSLPESYPAILMKTGQFTHGLYEVHKVWQHTLDRHGFLPLQYYRQFRSMGLPRVLGWLRKLKPSSSGEQFQHNQLISRDFAAQTQVLERLEALQQSRIKPNQALADQLANRITHPAIPAALERYDRIAALAGIDSRHPLVSRKLVEFVAQLPWQSRAHDGWSKYLLRAAGEGVVPDRIRWRQRRDENGWRFIDEFTRIKEVEMRTFIQDNRPSLNSYIDDKKLKAPETEDLLQLYALTKWLENEKNASH